MILKLVALMVFYLVVTPLGWILRLFARDPLGEGEDSDTYWVDCKSFRSSDMTRQR